MVFLFLKKRAIPRPKKIIENFFNFFQYIPSLVRYGSRHPEKEEYL